MFPNEQYLFMGDILMGRKAKVSLYRLFTDGRKHHAVKQLRRRKIVLRTRGRSEDGAQQHHEDNAIQLAHGLPRPLRRA